MALATLATLTFTGTGGFSYTVTFQYDPMDPIRCNPYQQAAIKSVLKRDIVDYCAGFVQGELPELVVTAT